REPVREHHSARDRRSGTDDSLRWRHFGDIAGRVTSGQIDPQSVVEAHLSAIDRFDSRIHAYVYVDRGAGGRLGPTLAVKDSQPVAGMPWTYGTPSWRDRIAQEDAVPVARARAAGMPILGKRTLQELAGSIGCPNTLFPATQTPWPTGMPHRGDTIGRPA